LPGIGGAAKASFARIVETPELMWEEQQCWLDAL